MTILVDTCIWSAAFRRRSDSNLPPESLQLMYLLKQHRAVMIGPILQEVLSGLRYDEQFEKLKLKLEAIELLPLGREDYLSAARLSNTCRKKGVQGSHIDFQICAIALKYEIPVFTTDKDFQYYKKHIPLVLYAG